MRSRRRRTNGVNANQVDVSLTLEPYESVLLVFQAEKRALPPRIEGALKAAREIAVELDPSVKEPPLPQLKAGVTAPTPTPAPGAKGAKGGTKSGAKGGKGTKAGVSRQSLADCAWVWYPEPGASGVNAPAGERYFRGVLTLPENAVIARARFQISADNGFALKINGQAAGKSDAEGESWRGAQILDVARLLQPGKNLVTVAAINGTDKPSPAGLIGKLTIGLAGGTTQTLRIDGSWKASDKKQEGWDSAAFDDKAWKNARVVARYGEMPWGTLGIGGARARRPQLTLGPVAAHPFNGKCEVPADVLTGKSRVFLVCGEIAPEAAARVTINGTYAGGFIEKPLRLDVTQQLKSGANTIRIEPFTPASVKLAVE